VWVRVYAAADEGDRLPQPSHNIDLMD
jgi:hypothetical protein